MRDTVVVAGNVCSDITYRISQKGTQWVRFAVVINPGRFDRVSGQWINDEPSYFDVVAWRTLAENIAASVHKGDPVMVSGRIRVRRWEGQDGRRNTSTEIEAFAVGHDLSRGRTQFTRPPRGPEGSLDPVAPIAGPAPGANPGAGNSDPTSDAA